MPYFQEMTIVSASDFAIRAVILENILVYIVLIHPYFIADIKNIWKMLHWSMKEAILL